MQDTETFAWTGYSFDTGAQLWGPMTGTTRAFSYYGSGLGGGQIGWTAYGKLYTQGLAVKFAASTVTTGAVQWIFEQCQQRHRDSLG